ncbi:MAG: hypothetical protein M1826_004491 [Phylliscum demangeonii]|nr:MAG: hypothetical protein M1826_004491 [Phylliscum demangeonii]
METTFISIHDLSIDARILYASDSIVDILGYAADEVIGKSCFDYFHPDEIPFARSVHGRGVELDKAAVLSYCRIRSRHARWVGCECVFTVVYDVLVASTSIYRSGLRSQKRAAEAPVVRRLFSSAPRDPRYHMLSLLSSKFSQGPSARSHEPRAAMFLNRFSRTLAIMYATTALSAVLGLTPEEVKGKSFYECIQENCLADAIRCLESAKANDSIAYMRFCFRDPRHHYRADERMRDGTSSSEDEDEEGGVYLNGQPNGARHSPTGSGGDVDLDLDGHDPDPGHPYRRTSSDRGTDLGQNAADAIFGRSIPSASPPSSAPASAGTIDADRPPLPPLKSHPPAAAAAASATYEKGIEVEAVVSCTSDGLVVVLRRARPIGTATEHAAVYAHGLFASPWAATPIMPAASPVGAYAAPRHPSVGRPGYAPEPVPVYADRPPPPPSVVQGAGGPPMEEFMKAIREVAVFAWSLTGINGSLAQYGRGRPRGEAQPADGMPVWDPPAKAAASAEAHHPPRPPEAQHRPYPAAGVRHDPPPTHGAYHAPGPNGFGPASHAVDGGGVQVYASGHHPHPLEHAHLHHPGPLQPHPLPPLHGLDQGPRLHHLFSSTPHPHAHLAPSQPYLAPVPAGPNGAAINRQHSYQRSLDHDFSASFSRPFLDGITASDFLRANHHHSTATNGPADYSPPTDENDVFYPAMSSIAAAAAAAAAPRTDPGLWDHPPAAAAAPGAAGGGGGGGGGGTASSYGVPVHHHHHHHLHPAAAQVHAGSGIPESVMLGGGAVGAPRAGGRSGVFGRGLLRWF